MTEPPIIDTASALRRRPKKNANDHILAELALSRCEQAFARRDWKQFAYWFGVYRAVRPTSQESRSMPLRIPLAENRSSAAEPATPASQFTFLNRRAASRLSKVALALCALMIAAPAPAQTPSYSLSNKGILLSSSAPAEMPATPSYMRLIAGRLWADDVDGTATANGFFYQISGATEISVDGKRIVLSAGEAAFMPSGAQLHLKAIGREPSAYFRFVLAPISYPDLPDLSPVNEHEIYRSSAPVDAAVDRKYVLTLTKVTLPFQSPPDMPHRRSGAALHIVLSGFGAETANGATIIKSPGSISFEPADLVYQWSNPGNVALTYLVFNVNRDAEAAILATAR